MVSILIVDDDKFLHKVLEKILIIGGHQVVDHAYDGAEALEKFVKLNPKPDIILMDHRMPVMNGATATREITRLNLDSLIIFISADDTVKEEAMQSGARDFLTKPIRSSELFSVIDKHSA
ncbi:MAG: response regulator [Candidatus Thorarchaeota archaeon]|nr:response regulator [Candidatus Thorarchaeota archaeon]